MGHVPKIPKIPGFVRFGICPNMIYACNTFQVACPNRILMLSYVKVTIDLGHIKMVGISDISQCDWDITCGDISQTPWDLQIVYPNHHGTCRNNHICDISQRY